MHDQNDVEYRIGSNQVPNYVIDARARRVALVHDERPKAVERHNPRRRALDQQLHGVVLNVTEDGVAGGLFADWWYDLRRGQLRLYGGLLRFIDLSILRRVPKRVLLMIPDTIREYIQQEHPEKD